MKIVFTAIVSLVILFPLYDFAYGKNSFDPDLTSLQVYKNLELIDLKILELQVIPREDTPNILDEADLLKIKFEVTKKDIGFFALSDKMFRIHVIDPAIILDDKIIKSSKKIDTYFTIYDDELRVRYKYLRPDISPNHRWPGGIFEECDYLKKRIFTREPAEFTICFDVLRRWVNEPLDLDGEKKFFLYMMANTQSDSCPNCKKILLSSNGTKIQLESKDIFCKKEFEKIFKPNGTPICVTPSTADVLKKRGWMNNR